MKRIQIDSVQPGDILFTARPGKVGKTICDMNFCACRCCTDVTRYSRHPTAFPGNAMAPMAWDWSDRSMNKPHRNGTNSFILQGKFGCGAGLHLYRTRMKWPGRKPARAYSARDSRSRSALEYDR
jgi:hypothetical protein